MKRCSSCSKDIPDAAMHCVFCGSKQPPVGPQQTVMGYASADLLHSLGVQHGQAPQPAQPPPQPRPVTPRPAPAPAYSPPPGVPQGPPQAAPPAMVSAPFPDPVANLPTGARPLYTAPPPGVAPVAPLRAAPAAPAHRPAYLASDSAKRELAPFEPWAGSLRALMIVLGLLVVATYAAPWVIPEEGKMLFSWDALEEVKAASAGGLVLYLFAASGLLALLLGILPVSTTVRGVGAAVAGAAPLLLLGFSGGDAIPGAGGGDLGWRIYALVTGLFVAPIGLVLRSQYRGSMAARLLATVGALGILTAFLVPDHGKVPLFALIDMVSQADGGGAAALCALLALALFAVLALLAWLPSSTSGGATLWAWLIMLWAPALISVLVLAASRFEPAVLLRAPGGTVYMALDLFAVSVLSAYGIATLLGKAHEIRA